MMKKTMCVVLASVLALGLSATVQATLIDRGNGLIYDDDLNITWTANANINGLMNWDAAVAWADSLSYGGYDDWRLPTALNADGTGPCSDWNCTGSEMSNMEMGHLFYDELGGVAGSSILSASDPNNYLALFSSVQSYRYWLSTEYTPYPTLAWSFGTNFGVQDSNATKDYEFYAWAVRSGDVIGVPEPATALLFGFGLAGLGMLRRRTILQL